MSIGGLNGEQWRWLTSSKESISMAQQLALSEALLATMHEASLPVIRWYVSEQPALVLGNGQKREVAKAAACRAAGVEVYQRTSGGTAILVDRSALSMEVALPLSHPLASGDIVRGYQWIGELWAHALQILGIEEARAIPLEEVRALPSIAKDDPIRMACYGTLSPFEPVVGQRKVVGLCQVRRRSAMLYQVGVHLRWRPEDLVALLELPDEARDPLTTRLHETAGGLDELVGRSVTTGEVRDAVHNLIAAQLDVCPTRSSWTATERAAADRIQREHFQPIGA